MNLDSLSSGRSSREMLPAEHPFSLESLAKVQAALTPVKEYSDKTAGEYFDAKLVVDRAARAEELEWPSKFGVSERAFRTEYWADPSIYDANGVIDTATVAAINARTESAMQKYRVPLVAKDEKTGLWLNPMLSVPEAPSLIDGRGVLGKYGMNETVDLRIVTRDPEGRTRVLSFKRPLNGNMLAMPGGYIDHGETAEQAIRREYGEEIKGMKIPGESWETMRKVGSYMVADPRATRLSWNGTTLFEIEVPWSIAQAAQFVDTPEAHETEFRPVGEGGVTADPGERFLGSHREMMTFDIEKR